MPVPATLRWMMTPFPKSSCSWPPLSGGSVRDAARMTTMLSSAAGHGPKTSLGNDGTCLK